MKIYDEPKYVIYRNKNIPGWWRLYLPFEKNPYHKSDTLTLQKGCLYDFWHIHSSNKYRNPRGVEACEFAQRMLYNRFGGAFLTNRYMNYCGRNIEYRYNEPDHLVYRNAYLKGNEIHIKNAYQYYEDVIWFMMNVLREISKNHYQSSNYGFSYNFFPSKTDAELKRDRIERLERKKLTEQLTQYVHSTEFLISYFKYSGVTFNANYDCEDGWYNVRFVFKDIATNIEDKIAIDIWMPSLYLKRDGTTWNGTYCLYLVSDGSDPIVIPENKVSDIVKETIQKACTQAMEAYNGEHVLQSIDEINYNTKNIFLYFNIQELNLTYKEKKIEHRYFLGI